MRVQGYGPHELFCDDDGWHQRHEPEPSSQSAEDEAFEEMTGSTYTAKDRAEWVRPSWPDLLLALQSLNPKHRFVIELRYGLKDGIIYAQREIALLMGISQPSVWELEQTALSKLHDLLSQGDHPALS